MTPLDLRIGPPRKPRETMLGYYFIPRTIDKIRSELDGGHPGLYVNDDPRAFSSWLVGKIGITMSDLRAIFARAHDESEVEAWLRERIDPAQADATNAKFETFVVSRMSPEDQRLVRGRHPVMAERPELDVVLDILAADDDRAFAERRGGPP